MLVKLQSGKTKAVIVQESEEYKNWHIDDKGWNIPQQVINQRQAIIDSFDIINGFLKKFREYETFMLEQYVEKRKEEIEYRAKMDYMEIPLMPREIMIPKIHFIKEDGTFKQYGANGAYSIESDLLDWRAKKTRKELFGKYMVNPRIAIFKNGDQIKYKEAREVEWFFLLFKDA
jgi:hypothetical protein